MPSHHFPIDPSFLASEPPASAEAKARARADSLMTLGHAMAFGGSLAGIAGGFALVANGALTPLIVALLFTGPIAGAALSGALYAAAWYANIMADRIGHPAGQTPLPLGVSGFMSNSTVNTAP